MSRYYDGRPREELPIHDHSWDFLNEYPLPLARLLMVLAERNRAHWLGEYRNPDGDGPRDRSDTLGAESVRDCGLTETERTWAREIAAEMVGEYWFCPYCCTVTIAREKPDTCPECDEPGAELQEANIRYD